MGKAWICDCPEGWIWKRSEKNYCRKCGKRVYQFGAKKK